jgi:hypothetical protein
MDNPYQTYSISPLTEIYPRCCDGHVEYTDCECGFSHLYCVTCYSILEPCEAGRSTVTP